MPACDGEGSIFIDDASKLFPGAVLYAEGVGYLKVVEVLDSSEVTVLNECPDCELHVLDPGNPVASGTQFGVGIPFCASEGDVTFLGPRLNSDFFIPDVGDCVLIAVTSIEGLAIGDVVSINTNRYRINDIPTVTTIEICNDGEGGEPGILVEKDPNGDGILDYPILRISSVNPCTADPVDAGRLLVCSTGSTQQAMEGTIEDQVPAWSEANEQFELKVMSGLATCVTLVCCLNVDPEADPCDTYLIDVQQDTAPLADALAFVAPNPLKIEIDGDPFCMTEVIDANTIRVIPDYDVGEVTQYEEGATICIAECCRQCSPTIFTMDDSEQDNGCTPDILLGTGQVVLTAPTGIETFTLPVSLAANNQSGFEEGANYLWTLVISNEECCDCRKYFKVESNFEAAGTVPDPGLTINIELRMCRTDPANSQAFASAPLYGDHDFIAAGTYAGGFGDLIVGAQTINTFKGMLHDRGFVLPGESVTYKGHVRIVTENTSGSPVDFVVAINWRIWAELWNFGCANITTDTNPIS